LIERPLSRRAFLRLALMGGACVAAAGPAAAFDLLPVRKPRPPRVLVLDPGHGGSDPGALGPSIVEKEVTLDIALHMAALLEGSKGVRVKLTRTTDVFLPLEDRVTFAREAKADLFVSIHADHAPNKLARGLSVYTLSETASDTLAGALAEQENKAGQVAGLDLSHTDKQVAAILFDLTARRTMNTAQRAKAAFIRLIQPQWRLLENPMRAANFVVLRSPDIPSMLIETGFLSNPDDARMLTKPTQRTKVAHAMANQLAKILESPIFS
jgi:N-acetylmuramoyl-L-alanine amidase